MISLKEALEHGPLLLARLGIHIVTIGIIVTFISIPKEPRNIGIYIGIDIGIATIIALIGPPINRVLLNN